MHRYLVNFHKSARERAADLSTRAYGHYKRFGNWVEKVYNPIKTVHNKYFGKIYGSGKKGTSKPR